LQPDIFKSFIAHGDLCNQLNPTRAGIGEDEPAIWMKEAAKESSPYINYWMVSKRKCPKGWFVIAINSDQRYVRRLIYR